MYGTRNHVKLKEPKLGRLITCFLANTTSIFLNKDIKAKGNTLRGRSISVEEGMKIKEGEGHR